MTEAERIYYLMLDWVREIDRRLTEGSIHVRDTSGRLIITLSELMVAIEMGTVEWKHNFEHWQSGQMVQVLTVSAASESKAVGKLSEQYRGVFRLVKNER